MEFDFWAEKHQGLEMGIGSENIKRFDLADLEQEIGMGCVHVI